VDQYPTYATHLRRQLRQYGWKKAPSKSNRGGYLHEKYRVPPQLIEELLDAVKEVVKPYASSSGFLFAGVPFPFGPAAAALLARLPLLLAGPPEPIDLHFC